MEVFIDNGSLGSSGCNSRGDCYIRSLHETFLKSREAAAGGGGTAYFMAKISSSDIDLKKKKTEKTLEEEDENSEREHCNSVLLTPRERGSVISENNHVVVPSWMRTLISSSLSPSSLPLASGFISLIPMVVTPTNYHKMHLTLDYVGFSSLSHWSEAAHIDSISNSSNTSNVSGASMWPQHLSRNVVEKLLPALLTGEHICLGSILAVEVLDYDLLLKVSSISFEKPSTLPVSSSSTASPSTSPSSSSSLPPTQVAETVSDENLVFILRSMETYISFSVDSLATSMQSSEITQSSSHGSNNSNSNSNSNIDSDDFGVNLTTRDSIVTLIREGYLSNFFAKFHDIIRLFLSNNIINNSFPMQTLLISGAEGAGKSAIISSLHGIIREFWRSSSNSNNSNVSNKNISGSSSDEVNFDLFIVPFDLSTIATQTAAIDSSISKDPQFSSDSTDTIFNHVMDLMKLLEVETAMSSQFRLFYGRAGRETNRKFVFVLTLDAMDELFLAHAEIIKEYTSAGDFELALKVSFALNRLFHAITRVNASDEVYANRLKNVQFIVVGTCRLAKSQVPVSNTQAPIFDMVLELPRLQYNDRHLLFRSLLAKYKNNLEGVVNSKESNEKRLSPLEGSTDHSFSCDDNLNSWAHLSAQLTAGSRPGDICRIISHFADLHIGSQQLVNNNNNNSSSSNDSSTSKSNSSRIENNDIERCMRWESMTRAIALTPPKLLSRLQNLQIGAELQSQRVKLTWSDFCGYSEVKSRLVDLLSRLTSNQTIQLAEKFHLPGSGRGFVLTGPSGCGKTYLSKVMASEVGMNIITVNSTEILSKYYGETENSLRTLFKAARDSSPCLLFFDEFDAISCKRSIDSSDSSSGNLNARVLSTFLNELDGISSDNSRSAGGSESNVVVVVACEHIDKLDDALVRPGRLSHHIELYKPDLDTIKEILYYKLDIKIPDDSNSNSSDDEGRFRQSKGIPCANDVDVEILAEHLYRQGASCADIDGLVKAASYNTIRRHVEAAQEESEALQVVAFVGSKDPAICWHDFVTAMSDSSKLNLNQSLDSIERDVFWVKFYAICRNHHIKSRQFLQYCLETSLE